jgi:thiamine monophosphate synthase
MAAARVLETGLDGIAVISDTLPLNEAAFAAPLVFFNGEN